MGAECVLGEVKTPKWSTILRPSSHGQGKIILKLDTNGKGAVDFITRSLHPGKRPFGKPFSRWLCGEHTDIMYVSGERKTSCLFRQDVKIGFWYTV
jgi:hypothetical protein